MHLVHSRWHKPKARPSKRVLQCRTLNAIRHGKKVEKEQDISEEETVISPRYFDFLLLHISCLKELFKNVRCNECDSKAIEVLLPNEQGFSTLIKLKCHECESVLSESYSSPKTNETKAGNSFIVNSKMTDAVNSIGLGHAALQNICIGLNINCISFESFYDDLQNLWTEAIELEEKVLTNARNAVREAYEIISPNDSNNSILDIAGSYNGTWLTSCNSSYGIGIIVDALTGLVVDFEICSKYCSQCSIAKKKFENDNAAFNVWHKKHKKNVDCNINFMGSSDSMEVEAAKRIWSRSILKNKMRYTIMVNDEDSESCTVLNKMAPYKNVIIEKEECINHFHKRLGTALRKLAKRLKGRKLKEVLTESTIIVLQSFYRQAITNNAPDIQKIQIAIQTTLDHYSSTDLKANHSNCPKGKDSSCFYNGALAQGVEPQSHETMKIRLSQKVLVHLQPIYGRLASDELLKRCTQTQTANESLHCLILRKCPKEIYVSKRKIHMVVVNAVSEYNTCVTESYKMKAKIKNKDMLANVQNLTRKPGSFKRKKSSEEYQEQRNSLEEKQEYAGKASRTSQYEAELH